MLTSQLSAFILVLMLVCTSAFALHSAITDPTSSKNLAIAEELKLSPDQLSTNSTFRFTENRGQLADQFGKPMPEVKYYGESNGVTLYFTAKGYHYVFSKPNAVDSTLIDFKRVDVSFVGTTIRPNITAKAATRDHTNYYLAHCPKGITDVRSFEKIVYRDLYPKVDMVLYSSGQGMKYDFIVRPGGDPLSIKLRIDNAEKLEATEDRFSLATSAGEAVESMPLSYQMERACKSTLLADTS